jgi:glycosyltransferase involved in cell wall biosynthesis
MSRESPREKTIRILGTHGVPAAYGGFETAAENVARFLADRGWRVIVYCQIAGTGPIREDTWNGLERVSIPIDIAGWRGTAKFDLISILHAARYRDLCLTFGYNTALFNALQRRRGIPNVVNMDGIEWSRARWGWFRQAILFTNERIACRVATHLIADHPEIQRYLLTRAPSRKVAMITYGAHAVEDAPTEPLKARGLEPGAYLTLICRPIPENSILDLVWAFSRRPRGHKLVVLGAYEPESDPYHRAVLTAASNEVVFVGSLYERSEVEALRFHSAAYLHGHTVGGTNPSLVEAMAAGNAVIAHDNVYNRWVAQDGAVYFSNADEVSRLLDQLLTSPQRLQEMGDASRRRHLAEFTWDHVAGHYEELLLRFLPSAS